MLRPSRTANMGITEPRQSSPPFQVPRLAMIVPYRDRAEHLREFVPHMVQYLGQSNAFTFSIHIIEQLGPQRFNRGKLLNVGAHLTMDRADYFCFHDVDYLP